MRKQWSYYSLQLSHRYCNIRKSLETARILLIIALSLWNLAFVTAAKLPSRLANIKAIQELIYQISPMWYWSNPTSQCINTSCYSITASHWPVSCYSANTFLIARTIFIQNIEAHQKQRSKKSPDYIQNKYTINTQTCFSISSSYRYIQTQIVEILPNRRHGPIWPVFHKSGK